ncbi:MAG TPA: hypothetical protein VFR64_00440 [Methylomirabilota bacterium]|nr:hypothetical protein [Methylomirabilota bacterium]
MPQGLKGPGHLRFPLARGPGGQGVEEISASVAPGKTLAGNLLRFLKGPFERPASQENPDAQPPIEVGIVKVMSESQWLAREERERIFPDAALLHPARRSQPLPIRSLQFRARRECQLLFEITLRQDRRFDCMICDDSVCLNLESGSGSGPDKLQDGRKGRNGWSPLSDHFLFP